MVFPIIQGLLLGTMYGLFALGIVLVFRGTKVINFAAPALGSLGLFIAHVLHVEQGANWLAAVLVGVLASGAVALAFERLVLRRMHDASPLALAVATIGLMLLIVSTELVAFGGSPRNLPGPLRGNGISLLSVRVTPTQLLSVAVAILLGALLTQFLRRSDFGLGVQAAAMDADAVRLVGVRLHEVNMFVWAVAGMLAVVAAVLVLPTIGGFQPYTVTKVFFVPSLAAAMIGGLDELGGAFPGGLLVGLAVSLSNHAFLGSGFVGPQHVTVLVSIVLVLLLAPKGVLARLRPLRAARVGEVAA